MAKQEVLLGQTDYSVLVLIRDDAGAPKTGLTESDIDIAYARVETDNDVTTADVTPAALAALTDAHADWGFEEVSATDHPGVYRLDIADAVFATGAWSAIVSIVGTGLDPTSIEFELVAVDKRNSVRMGLTALPNAAADAAGGLPISDAGGLDLDAQVGTKIDSILEDTGTTLDDLVDGLETELAKVPKSDGTSSWNATALAAIQSEANDALVAYDPPTKAELDTAIDALPTAAENADAVWDEDATGHQTGGTFGQAIGDPGANTETIYEAVVTDAAGTNVAADIIAAKTVIDQIESQTDDIGVAGAGLTEAGGTGDHLTALATQASVNTIDDLLDTEMPALTTAVADIPTNAELTTAIAVGTDAVLDAIRIRKNTEFTWVFKLVDDTDHVTAETGISVTATRSIDGAAFGACANSAAEIANGWYKIVLAAADVNGDIIIVRFTGTGCDASEAVFITQPAD